MCNKACKIIKILFCFELDLEKNIISSNFFLGDQSTGFDGASQEIERGGEAEERPLDRRGVRGQHRRHGSHHRITAQSCHS